MKLLSNIIFFGLLAMPPVGVAADAGGEMVSAACCYPRVIARSFLRFFLRFLRFASCCCTVCILRLLSLLSTQQNGGLGEKKVSMISSFLVVFVFD
jgi:hypothetical protein